MVELVRDTERLYWGFRLVRHAKIVSPVSGNPKSDRGFNLVSTNRTARLTEFQPFFGGLLQSDGRDQTALLGETGLEVLCQGREEFLGGLIGLIGADEEREVLGHGAALDGLDDDIL